MKNRLPSAVILLTLLLVLCLHALAAEDDPFDSGLRTSASNGAGYVFTNLQETVYTDYRDVIPTVAAVSHGGNLRTGPDITANGVSIGHMTARTLVDSTTYIEVLPLMDTLFPNTTASLESGHLTVAAPEVALNATLGDDYFQVNGRYLYAPLGVLDLEGRILLPLDTLCDALGCSLLWEGEDLIIRQVESPVSAGTYNENDLYWLSRAIYAESGNQPLAGRIAVGTVILNRVADPAFPNSIYDVIFAPGQFDPVDNGTIYREPDKDSIVAAQLCLDGVREAEGALFFHVTSLYSWADRARPYCCTIGDHKFFY